MHVFIKFDLKSIASSNLDWLVERCQGAVQSNLLLKLSSMESIYRLTSLSSFL